MYPTKGNKGKYKQYRNRLTSIIREQRRNSMQLQRFKTNIKATWSVIREVTDQMFFNTNSKK